MRYWDQQGKYQDLYKLFWKRYVPEMGEADCTRGEVLRNIGRLYYDCYNNGLMNDKSDEVKYLLDYRSCFTHYLPKDSKGLAFLRELIYLYTNDDWVSFDFSEENNKALDDLVDAILLYIQDDEKKEIESIPLELRLTDPRDWVREYKEAV
jgi:hypothetical protein